MNRRFLFTIGLLLLALSASAKRVGAYCYLANDGSQLYEDSNVKVELAMENENLILTIYNKTNDAIHVDRANSFIYNNDHTLTTLMSNSCYLCILICNSFSGINYKNSYVASFYR